MHRLSRISLNNQWHFHRGEPGPATQISDWDSITLPHSWNALDTMETNVQRHYYRGIGWYERDVAPPPLAEDQRLWLEIEAAAMKAQVYLNGKEVGRHNGGYTAFTLELTPAASHQHSTNEKPPIDATMQLSLSVDNSPDPDLIPSDLSDFFLYGGLTRNVWLYQTGLNRIVYAHFDTQVTAEQARITLRGRLVDPVEQPLTVNVAIYDPEGKPVAEMQTEVHDAGFTIPLETIEQPRLWSPDTPSLYRAVVTLHNGNEIWDTVTEQIGLRFFAFPKDGPFYLNGQPLRLHGTHRHEDWAGRGSAVPDDLSRQELRLIRDAGFNFIRLGHYPQAPAVLEACDQLGLLVWEELPWCRGGIGGDLFKQQARTMFEEMVEQHYNHSSIIFWGLGNELDWVSEHPASTDEKVLAFLSELHELSHQLDPQRLTALRRFEPGASVVDVYSPSIWPGWYNNNQYTDYEEALTRAVARYPRMLHIEWGGDSHYGRHNTGPHIRELSESEAAKKTYPRASTHGDWSESYILDLMEWHLRVQLNFPQLAGNAQWSFKDFGTPGRPENPLPYVNQKGLVDRAGRPKDVYYLFQSYLTRTPACHIESPTWPVRVGKAGEPQQVRVYSNCPRVELFVNGQSAGEKKRDPEQFPAAGLVWHVPLQPGENELRAIAHLANGSTLSSSIKQEYVIGPVGPAACLQCWTEVAHTPDGDDAYSVIVQLVDEECRPVIDDSRLVTFSLKGNGQLWHNRGIMGGSSTVELANGRASMLVLPGSGATTVRVEAQDGLVSEIVIGAS
ncbi:MAG TPA: glycoside hydrolase family 2 TIM barrel-domain containing protein [Ktedonosporobacter sp.]|nr:glycoside hydrolase family 2 TIM barrel-domain containing protein [Ktedonosporobacter sp.]